MRRPTRALCREAAASTFRSATAALVIGTLAICPNCMVTLSHNVVVSRGLMPPYGVPDIDPVLLSNVRLCASRSDCPVPDSEKTMTRPRPFRVNDGDKFIGMPLSTSYATHVPQLFAQLFWTFRKALAISCSPRAPVDDDAFGALVHGAACTQALQAYPHWSTKCALSVHASPPTTESPTFTSPLFGSIPGSTQPTDRL